MTITLELTAEQEQALRDGAASQNAEAVRQVLVNAIDRTVKMLLRPQVQPTAEQRQAILLDLASGLADAPVLSAEAFLRAGIYGDHP